MPAWATGAWATGAWAGTAWAETGVTVPDVVGQSQASGTTELEGDGFVVAVATAYSSTVAVGDIISQSPLAGAEVPSGSTVTITVSLGEAPPPPAQSDAAGGWGFYLRYEQERDRRRRKRREQEEAEEAVKELPPVEREIAQFLHKQERKDERRAELERLKALVKEHSPDELPERVASAFERAAARQTVSALMNLEKELKRMAEDEENLVLMLLLNG